MSSAFDLPRHLYVPTLGGLEHQILCFIAQHTMPTGYVNYVASWHISEALPLSSDLDVIADSDMPGNKAMRRLKALGLVEDEPNLGCRYRLTALGCALYLIYEKNGITLPSFD